MKIILAGGSGSIGTFLADYFSKRSHEVVILSRKLHPDKNNIRYVLWDAKTTGAWIQELNGADILINLAGKSVNCRYTEKNKKEILNSRIFATRILCEAVKATAHPPAVFFNAASATIYRHAMDHAQDEFTGETGSDFSMNVCKAWEKAFMDFHFTDTRQVILRIAITLGIKGGIISRFRNLVRYGLGGKMATGKQMMSWVNAEDIARSIEFITEHKELDGIINVTSPYPVDNNSFMKALRQNMHMPFGIPSPKWLLAFGAFMIGTETELILKSRWVIPARLTNAGFEFKCAKIESSLS